MKSWALAVIAVAVLSTDTSAQSSPADTAYDEYREDIITLPLGVGLRIPSYDRVNGVSIPWGPQIRTPNGKLQIDPIVTYRSNLGQFDPSGTMIVALGKADSISVFGGRGTFTNDTWIRSDLINSLASLGVGSDARNYYRADKVNAEIIHGIEREPWHMSLWVGGSHEYDWSTGIHEKHDEAPWSLLNKSDTLKMRRVNPLIANGHITSVLAGSKGSYERHQVKGKFDLKVERSIDGPDLGQRGDGKFTQATIDGKASFPTFGMQTFTFKGHAVISGGGAPPQRFSYLGGAGTLSTVDLLALGGDQLVFVEGEYRYPLTRPLLPFVGAPVLSARYAAGSAGVDDLPDFIQNIGVGIGLKFVKIEYHIDPNYKKTSFSDKNSVSIGFSLSL